MYNTHNIILYNVHIIFNLHPTAGSSRSIATIIVAQNKFDRCNFSGRLLSKMTSISAIL